MATVPAEWAADFRVGAAVAGNRGEPDSEPNHYLPAPKKLRAGFYSNVANVGGLQIPGVKGEVVVLYFEPLTTQKLKSSGVPGG